MKRRRISWPILLTAITVISLLPQPSWNARTFRPSPIRQAVAQDSGTMRINEVMFYPESGGVEWVELRNTSQTSVDIGGFSLTDEDDNWYHFPDNPPPVPPGAFVVVLFDGAGADSDDDDFADNVATFHSEPGVVDIFEGVADQVSLYSDGVLDQVAIFLPIVFHQSDLASLGPNALTAKATLDVTDVDRRVVDFIAWGVVPGLEAEAAAEGGIWKPNWAIPTVRGTGFDGGELLPGEAVARLAGVGLAPPDNWTVVQPQETTQGESNVVPTISWSTAAPHAVLDSSAFTLGWSYITGAVGYQFQLDDEDTFTSPIVDTVLSEPVFAPVNGVLAGNYHWRVRVLFSDSRSEWSPATAIKSASYSARSHAQNEGGKFVAAANVVRKTLQIDWQLQHKDTRLLYLDGMPEDSSSRWDSSHEADGNWHVGDGTPVRAHRLDYNYCVRASLSMFVSFYGGDLSQDRISFQIYGQGEPEGDLGLPTPLPTAAQLVEAANWALNGPEIAGSNEHSFEQLKSWIDEDRAIIANVWLYSGGRNVPHVRLITGYEEVEQADGSVQQSLYVLDPYTSAQWLPYSSDTTFYVWIGPSGEDSAPNVLSDEDEDSDGIPDTIDDSDEDGVADFDERHRFPGLDWSKPDSDSDGIADKKDMRGYLFDNEGKYREKTISPDVDGDGLRKESDPDNDGGGAIDGCEDSNKDGKYQPELGETSNFADSDDNLRRCSVTGDWTGFLTQPGRIFSLTMSLNQEGTSISGTSEIHRLDGYYAIMNLHGSVVDGTIRLEETEIVDSTSAPGWYWCYKIMDLALTEEHGAMVLDGAWTDPGCNSGTLTLKRSDDPFIPIDGHWDGNLYQSTKTFTFELDLIQESGSLGGTSTIDNGTSWATMEVVGLAAGGSVLLKETGIAEKSAGGPTWCIKTMRLTYNSDGELEELAGPWHAPNCTPGTIEVQQ